MVASLCFAKALHRDEGQYGIIVQRTLRGHCEITVDGATRAEERLFLDALGELLGPIQNPRYLLVRTGGRWGGRQVDYHAVPALLGARKEVAEHFLEQWRRQVGTLHLIYARTADGRRALLRARVMSFAAA